MIKIYGMNTCPDCIYIYPQIEGNEKFTYVEISAHVKNLKEFITLRDTNEAFTSCKEKGSLGIPCFLLEDGTVTLSPEDVGLKSRSEEE